MIIFFLLQVYPQGKGQHERPKVDKHKGMVKSYRYLADQLAEVLEMTGIREITLSMSRLLSQRKMTAHRTIQARTVTRGPSRKHRAQRTILARTAM